MGGRSLKRITSRILFSQGPSDITSSKVNLQLGLGRHVLIVSCPTPFTDQVKGDRGDKFYEGHEEGNSVVIEDQGVVSTRVLNFFFLFHGK